MSQRDIPLIGSTIRNGRIYFLPTDVNFFPANAYGDRAGDGHKGEHVRFKSAGLTIETDIRISSGQRLSPRRSFAFFLKKAGAVEGGVLRVKRVSEREYEVEYLA